MYQLQQQPQKKKKKSPVRQEEVIARKQTAQPVPVRMDIPEIVQFRKFTAEQIITMAAELGLTLDANTHQSFIRLLTGIDTSGWRWLLFFRPVERVRRLLRIAQRYGSMVTERDYEENGEEAILFLEKLDQESFTLNIAGREPIKESTLLRVMDDRQKAEWMQQLQILLPISGAEGTKKAVESALFYVGYQYINGEEGTSNQPEYYIQSLQSVTAFIKTTYEGLNERIRQNCWLESSGSDRHMGGRHVLFLINKHNSNDRKVYKPRSVAIDDALIGEEGIFNEINVRLADEDRQISQDSEADESLKASVPSETFEEEKLEEESPDELPFPHLATMQINEHSGRDNQPFGTEKYVTKKGTFTVKEAKDYYFQMGVLQVASRYVGLTDLHQDNIMPTEKGPLPIDAEVGLFFKETLLNRALTSSQNQLGQWAMAHFEIIGKGPRCFDWKEENAYYKRYMKGQEIMEQKMASLVQQSDFAQILFEKTNSLSTRIVPVATVVFTEWYSHCVREKFKREEFCRYMCSEDEMLNQRRDEFILGALRDATKENDTEGNDVRPYFRKKDAEVIFPDPEIIPHLIFDAFCRHDIPIFELQLKNGEQLTYLLEGIPIGHTKVEFRYRDKLRR